MSAERFIHANGGGVLVGSDCAVSSDSFVSRDSLIEGRSFISNGSRIISSSIKDTHASFAHITGSPVLYSHITGAIVRDSGLEGVVIRGTNLHTAKVQNCLLSNKVVVEGCSVQGFELAGPFLLHTDWARAPRARLLEPAPGVQMGISECTRGRMHCGCECRPAAEWIQKKELLRKIFVRRGWSSESIDIIHELFEEWRRIRLAA